jgi:O-methyltransferase
MILSLVKICKDFLLWSRLMSLLSPLNQPFQFISNFNKLSKFVHQHKAGLLLNDFYSFKRDYNKRYLLYQTVAESFQLHTQPICYLEFGVAHAASFKWWLNKNEHQASSFFGFDTFEGLPENWGGFYKKGSMLAALPNIEDTRASFVKGIFQDTVPSFIAEQGQALLNRPKLIHLDADLFSSTIFVLSQLYPYLKKGDIILFDEFNVANHEWQAFQIFTDAFYVKLKLVAAVNNFYQVAFVVE